MTVLLTGLLAGAGGLGALALWRREARRRARRAEEGRARLRRIEEAHRQKVCGTPAPPPAPKPPAVFPRRTEQLRCPYCWTVQPGSREVCCGYRCGARFTFLDELEADAAGQVG